MSINSREIVFNILFEVFERDGYSNITLNKHLGGVADPREENLIREMVYGIIENDIYLEDIISRASKIKIGKIHPQIKLILKIGIYQLLFMDGIPDRAAVNETVNLAKKHGHRGTIGYVNGVLRNIGRDKDEFKNIEKSNIVDYLSVKYSHPKWLVKRWIKDYGLKFTKNLSRANNETPKLNIRVNNLKIGKDELRQRLFEKGINVQEGKYARDILIIDNPTRITSLEEFKAGFFTIQDESSALVAQILDPLPGTTIIDLCSAPGGKSTHLAQMMNNQGRILSLDIHKHKIKLIEDNSKRLGIDIIETYVSDAEKFNKDLVNLADYVLVDAPCSGFGLIRRKPEIKRKRKEGDIEKLVSIQRNILNNAKDYLKPGGILLYSTCTISKEENIDLIQEFVDTNKNFSFVGFEDKIDNLENPHSLKEGYLQLFPHIHNTDGFFYAKLIKER
ncbi:MAG: 16S rRNA (cytosine(967)-C(5))-methyltransferase RsmB [Tissierellaceae bacterium]